MTCLNCGARPVVGGPAFVVRNGVAWCAPCDDAAQADAALRRAAAHTAIAAVRYQQQDRAAAWRFRQARATGSPHATARQAHFGRDWPGGARGQHSGGEVRR